MKGIHNHLQRKSLLIKSWYLSTCSKQDLTRELASSSAACADLLFVQ